MGLAGRYVQPHRKLAIDVKVCKASLSGAREDLLYFIRSSLAPVLLCCILVVSPVCCHA